MMMKEVQVLSDEISKIPMANHHHQQAGYTTYIGDQKFFLFIAWTTS